MADPTPTKTYEKIGKGLADAETADNAVQAKTKKAEAVAAKQKAPSIQMNDVKKLSD